MGPAQFVAVDSELRSGNRPSNAPNAMRASSRARGAPKQKWMPCPNPRCGRGSRLMSSTEGAVVEARISIGRAETNQYLLACRDLHAGQRHGLCSNAEMLHAEPEQRTGSAPRSLPADETGPDIAFATGRGARGGRQLRCRSGWWSCRAPRRSVGTDWKATPARSRCRHRHWQSPAHQRDRLGGCSRWVATRPSSDAMIMLDAATASGGRAPHHGWNSVRNAPRRGASIVRRGHRGARRSPGKAMDMRTRQQGPPQSPVPPFELVEQLVGDAPDRGLEGGDPRGQEGPRHQAA